MLAWLYTVPRKCLSSSRAVPHGHVATVLGSARACDAAVWFCSGLQGFQALLLALLEARVIEPASKLATRHQLCDDIASSRATRLMSSSPPICE